MGEKLKEFFDLWCKGRWLKRIDKELNEYNKLKRCLGYQRNVVNVLIDEFNKIYGENIPKV